MKRLLLFFVCVALVCPYVLCLLFEKAGAFFPFAAAGCVF